MIPLFTSHYSTKSILTLEAKKKSSDEDNGPMPISIVDIASENKMKEVYLVENTFSSFIEAYKNLRAIDVNLRFGLQLNICPDLNDKSSESFYTTHRIICWILNQQGYYDLIKIHNLAQTVGLYEVKEHKFKGPRIDYEHLNKYWTENLALSIPFYDSYIFKNLLCNGQSIPLFDKRIKPTYLIENNLLPFDELIRNTINSTISDDFEKIECKSIYYNKREDFDAYLVYRAIQRRGSYDDPKLQYFGSREFCMESFLEKNK